MCITTPAKILKIEGNKAIVEINEKKTEVRIDLVDAKVGDYVYCASGMAIERAESR
jgi:hydrogenase assembly chaperone HypC/HupF